MKKTLSLQKLLLISVTSIFCIATIIQGFYLYRTVSNEISENVIQTYSNSIDIYAQSLNGYFDSIERLSSTIKVSDAVESALSTNTTDDFYKQHLANEILTDYLRNLSFSFEGIAGILLLTDNREVYNYANSFGFYEMSRISNQTLLSNLSLENTSGYIGSIANDVVPNSYIENLFMYYEKVYHKEKIIYTLCILVDSNIFSEIVGNNGKVIITSSDKRVYPLLENYDENGYIQKSAVLSNNWKVSNLIPINNINESSANVASKLFFGFILTLVPILIMVIFIVRYFKKHMDKLVKRMSSHRNYKDIVVVTSYIDEINILNTEFDSMCHDMDKLFHEVISEQKEKDRAKYKLLQSQINPHFLYNTLDAINWMALDIEAFSISEMTSNLANLFRYGLNQGNELSDIKNELLHVQAYTEIQKYRFDNRFSFTKDIDETILHLKTINIILQPLVENCLMHAFRSDSDHIDIKIEAFILNQKTVEIIISDNGKGADYNFLNDYLDSPSTTTKGYGVKNIHERIRLYFSNEYGISYLESTIGTKVSVKIPYIKNL